MARAESGKLREKGGQSGQGRFKSITTALFVLIVLFVLATGMLVYYQFYEGNGKWRFTLLHKSNDTTFLIALKSRYDLSKALKDTIRPQKRDSSIVKTDTARHFKPSGNIKNDDSLTGTNYEVQIGTFENYGLKKYSAVFNNLHEEKNGNLTKLTLGRFKSIEEANTFRKDMAKLGIKQAWVVKKVNGKRM